MAEPLVFAPDYLLPVDTQGAVGYREGNEPDAEVLERVGFFVPAYIEHPNADWMARMPRLDVVQLPTVGFDAVVPHLPTGVTLCNAAGVHEQSTAELAVGSIITVWRGLDRAARDMIKGTWGHRRGRSLQQARVVIIGAGGVGTAIARALEPFGCSTTVLARTGRPGVTPIADLHDILPRTDVVILAVPLTDETAGMVNDDFLSRLSDGSLVVNVSRGSVAVTEDILRHAGRLEFALDVTEPEPLPETHPLWSTPGVFITPHIGGDTDAFPRLARQLIGQQVERWRNDQGLRNVVASG
ncbi:MAG: NAD(P)-dependent oxidoreductase [Actinomycetota bacterium]